MDKDHEELRDWMHHPDVRAAVARQSEAEEEEEPLEPEQGRLWEEEDGH